jgi:hypothetical protein
MMGRRRGCSQEGIHHHVNAWRQRRPGKGRRTLAATSGWCGRLTLLCITTTALLLLPPPCVSAQKAAASPPPPPSPPPSPPPAPPPSPSPPPPPPDLDECRAGSDAEWAAGGCNLPTQPPIAGVQYPALGTCDAANVTAAAATAPRTCHPAAVCRDFYGAYECLCPPGYVALGGSGGGAVKGSGADGCSPACAVVGAPTVRGLYKSHPAYP